MADLLFYSFGFGRFTCIELTTDILVKSKAVKHEVSGRYSDTSLYDVSEYSPV